MFHKSRDYCRVAWANLFARAPSPDHSPPRHQDIKAQRRAIARVKNAIASVVVRDNMSKLRNANICGTGFPACHLTDWKVGPTGFA